MHDLYITKIYRPAAIVLLLMVYGSDYVAYDYVALEYSATKKSEFSP